MGLSYHNKMLCVDLSTGKSDVREIRQHDYEHFIGGKGIGAKILYDLVPDPVDPFDGQNPLMFLTGPLTGTLAPCMRGVIVTKSPATGIFNDSYHGGNFSQEIRFAGYDGILVRGIAPDPVYVWIDDDTVEVREAHHLWGKDTYETYDRVRQDLGDPSVRIACIGPAGENLVPFANVDVDYHRQSGRAGVGAVMGSKKLKAIVIRGGQPVRVKSLSAFRDYVDRAIKEIDESPGAQSFVALGTAQRVLFTDNQGMLPTRNFSRGSFDEAAKIGGEAQREWLWLRDMACQACPIRCSKIGMMRRGRFRAMVSENIEFETCGILGSNLEIGNLEGLAYSNILCDRLGLDTISTGGVIGFAIEAYEKGLLSRADTGGLTLRFGDIDLVHRLIRSIATRKGLGNLLAKGVRDGARSLGGEAEKIAVHVKGLESPAWGPRSTPGMGLALMTGDRGGCHMRALPAVMEIAGARWPGGGPVERLSTKEKGPLVAWLQNNRSAVTTLVSCAIAQSGITMATYLGLLEKATGIGLTEDEFSGVGERVWNLVRLFNLRQGLTREADTLPPRFQEPLPDGPAKGHRFSEEDMRTMLDDYYEARGWDRRGIPTQRTLDRVGLTREVLDKTVL